MSDQPASSVLLALSTELASLIRDVAPSLVSIQSARARSTGFSWRPGPHRRGRERAPGDGELSVVAHDGASSPAQMSAAIRRRLAPRARLGSRSDLTRAIWTHAPVVAVRRAASPRFAVARSGEQQQRQPFRRSRAAASPKSQAPAWPSRPPPRSMSPSAGHRRTTRLAWRCRSRMKAGSRSDRQRPRWSRCRKSENRTSCRCPASAPASGRRTAVGLLPPTDGPRR